MDMTLYNATGTPPSILLGDPVDVRVTGVTQADINNRAGFILTSVGAPLDHRASAARECTKIGNNTYQHSSIYIRKNCMYEVRLFKNLNNLTAANLVKTLTFKSVTSYNTTMEMKMGQEPLANMFMAEVPVGEPVEIRVTGIRQADLDNRAGLLCIKAGEPTGSPAGWSNLITGVGTRDLSFDTSSLTPGNSYEIRLFGKTTELSSATLVDKIPFMADQPRATAMDITLLNPSVGGQISVPFGAPLRINVTNVTQADLNNRAGMLCLPSSEPVGSSAGSRHVLTMLGTNSITKYTETLIPGVVYEIRLFSNVYNPSAATLVKSVRFKATGPYISSMDMTLDNLPINGRIIVPVGEPIRITVTGVTQTDLDNQAGLRCFLVGEPVESKTGSKYEFTATGTNKVTKQTEILEQGRSYEMRLFSNVNSPMAATLVKTLKFTTMIALPPQDPPLDPPISINLDQSKYVVGESIVVSLTGHDKNDRLYLAGQGDPLREEPLDSITVGNGNVIDYFHAPTAPGVYEIRLLSLTVPVVDLINNAEQMTRTDLKAVDTIVSSIATEFRTELAGSDGNASRPGGFADKLKGLNLRPEYELRPMLSLKAAVSFTVVRGVRDIPKTGTVLFKEIASDSGSAIKGDAVVVKASELTRAVLTKASELKKTQ